MEILLVVYIVNTLWIGLLTLSDSLKPYYINTFPRYMLALLIPGYVEVLNVIIEIKAHKKQEPQHVQDRR